MQNLSNGSAPARRMTLAAITKGKVAKPLRIVMYGTEGVGKTHFAADAPDTIFLPGERGTEHLDVARLPVPRNYTDVTDGLELLLGEHPYRTVAVDTLDWIEPFVWAQTCATKRMGGDKRAESIEDYGYGKGYIFALDVWRQFLSRLDALVERRGMTVILIAHCRVSMFKNPDGEDYQRYEMKLDAKASGLIKEWSDCVLFAQHETSTYKVSDKRFKGISTGGRIIHTERTAAYDAKNRQGLPAQLPLSWEAFAAAANAGESPATWRERIVAMLASADAELRTKVEKAVADSGDDTTRLAKIANRLTVTLGGSR